MTKLSATALATLLVAVAGASTSAFAQEGSLTREQVRAEVLRAQAAGEFLAPKAEDYGVFVSPRAAQPQQSTREAASATETKTNEAKPAKARSESWHSEHNPQDYGVFLPTGTTKKASEQYARGQ